MTSISIPGVVLSVFLAHTACFAKDLPSGPLQSVPGARELIEQAGGTTKNRKGQWELNHHWIGEMKTIVGDKPNPYANLAGRLRFDIIGTTEHHPDMPALEQSYVITTRRKHRWMDPPGGKTVPRHSPRSDWNPIALLGRRSECSYDHRHSACLHHAPEKSRITKQSNQ